MSPCLFNLYADYIVRNARLDEAQDEIKFASSNINTLRYADDITLIAESEKELKSLLVNVREFIAVLFTIARKWKKPRCPLTDEWIKML